MSYYMRFKTNAQDCKAPINAKYLLTVKPIELEWSGGLFTL